MKFNNVCLIDMIEIELDIRIAKLKEFEDVAYAKQDDSCLRFHARWAELESIQSFIEYHKNNV